MNLAAKGLIAILILVVFQILLFGALCDLHNQLRSDEHRTEHSLLVNKKLSDCVLTTINLLNNERAHADVVTDDMLEAVSRDLEDATALNELFKDDRERKRAAERAKTNLEICVRNLQYIRASMSAHQFDQDASYKKLFKPTREAIGLVLDDLDYLMVFMAAQEQFTKASLLHLKESQKLTIQLLQIAIAAEVLLLLIFFVWFKRDIAKRFDVLLKNSDLIARHMPLVPTLPGKDEIAQLDSSLHEISQALNQSLDRERATVKHARDLICQIDDQLQFTQVNDASLYILNYRPHQLTDLKLTDVLHPLDKDRVASQFHKGKIEEELPFESRLLTKDNRTIETLWSMRWSDRDQSFFCVVHDITVQKRAERFRQEVMQMVSHDIKTPLFTVSSFLEMAQNEMFGKLSQEGQNVISIAFQGAAEMLTLVKNLLDMEKIKAGMLELQLHWEDLASILDQSIESIGAAPVAKGVTIQRSPTDLKVYADRDRLADVIATLLKQAIRISPAGSDVVLRTEQTGGWTEISLVDGGSDLPASALNSILEGFSDSPAPGDSASRLALSISKAMAKLHGGEINATRRDDKSGQFTLRLPATAAGGAGPDQHVP